jgi:hypothetical protein
MMSRCDGGLGAFAIADYASEIMWEKLDTRGHLGEVRGE